MIRSIMLLLVICLNFSCGVKGKPQPPLNPSQLGRGTPSFNKATENIKIPKNKKIPGDFVEPSDFEPEKEEK
jgi:hypothetical protein